MHPPDSLTAARLGVGVASPSQQSNLVRRSAERARPLAPGAGVPCQLYFFFPLPSKIHARSSLPLLSLAALCSGGSPPEQTTCLGVKDALKPCPGPRNCIFHFFCLFLCCVLFRHPPEVLVLPPADDLTRRHSLVSLVGWQLFLLAQEWTLILSPSLSLRIIFHLISFHLYIPPETLLFHTIVSPRRFFFPSF